MASFITHDYEFVCTEGATYSVTTWKKYYRYFFIAITITKIATRIAVILTSTNLTRQPCWLYNFIAFENDKDFYTNRFNQLKTVWPMCIRPLIYYNFHLFIYEKKQSELTSNFLSVLQGKTENLPHSPMNASRFKMVTLVVCFTRESQLPAGTLPQAIHCTNPPVTGTRHILPTFIWFSE